MHIGIISNDSFYERFRIIQEAKKKGKVSTMKLQNLCLFVGKNLEIRVKQQNLSDLNVIIPRFSTYRMDFGLMVLEQIEKMGIPSLNSSKSMLLCQNKYLTSLALQRKRIPQPRSALATSAKEIVKHIQHMQKPVIFKVLYGGCGSGVAMINNDSEAQDWITTVGRMRHTLYIQEYIQHDKPEDYRLFVVGDRIVGAMRRIANPGQWKTNFSLGNKIDAFKPNPELKQLALKAAKAVGANLCGVDIMKGINGYEVIEINQRPGFKGLEKATGKNIAKEIVNFAIKIAKK